MHKSDHMLISVDANRAMHSLNRDREGLGATGNWWTS